MTENKRFKLKYINEQHISANLYDNKTFIGSIGMGEELIVELLNDLSQENEQLKKLLECSREEANDYCEELMEKDEFIRLYKSQRDDTIKENEQLKVIIKEVTELLSEEVDLFSDKATEHDINAYVELKELDNKDAFYMAIATKKAIKMLKELQKND